MMKIYNLKLRLRVSAALFSLLLLPLVGLLIGAILGSVIGGLVIGTIGGFLLLLVILRKDIDWVDLKSGKKNGAFLILLIAFIAGYFLPEILGGGSPVTTSSLAIAFMCALSFLGIFLLIPIFHRLNPKKAGMKEENPLKEIYSRGNESEMAAIRIDCKTPDDVAHRKRRHYVFVAIGSVAGVLLIAMALFFVPDRGDLPTDRQDRRNEADLPGSVYAPQVEDGIGAVSANGVLPEETHRIGNENIGYVDVPANWIRFLDLDGGTDLQYSDAIGQSIITMSVFDTAGLTEEQKKQVNLDSASRSLWMNIENKGGREIIGARVTLGNYDANQIYAYFDDGKILVTWIFAAEDGQIHYLAAEGTADEIMNVVSYVEQTFSLAE